jgi:hypothetical protein
MKHLKVCGFGVLRSAPGLPPAREQHLTKYGRPANSDPCELRATLVGALSDWMAIFQALHQPPPPDMEPDAHLDSLQQEEQVVGQEASDPLGGFGPGLTGGMMSTASWEDVSTYIEQNCGAERV